VHRRLAASSSCAEVGWLVRPVVEAARPAERVGGPMGPCRSGRAGGPLQGVHGSGCLWWPCCAAVLGRAVEKFEFLVWLEVVVAGCSG
jgi:hypothetical protein